MTTTLLRLVGYRSEHRPLLSGHWLPGEAIGLPLAGVPAFARPHSVSLPEPGDGTALYVVPSIAFVRFVDLDWVHRKARVEIGVQPGNADLAAELLWLALSHAFSVLRLHRVTGWATPAADPPTAALSAAGFVQEAVVPQAIWFDGAARDRALVAVVDR